MKVVEAIEYINFENIKNNIESYKQHFEKEGLLLFRNANLSLSEQEQLQNFFGNHFNAFPNEENPYKDFYEEDHSRNSVKSKVSNDTIILD
jgi:hypothetical protein